MYAEMKTNLKLRVEDPDSFEALKKRIEKGSASTDTYRQIEFSKRPHDDHSDDHLEGENAKKRKTTEEPTSTTATISFEPTKQSPPLTSSEQPKQHTTDETSSSNWDVRLIYYKIERAVVEEESGNEIQLDKEMGNNDEYELEEFEIPPEKVSLEFLDELKLMGLMEMLASVNYTRMEEKKNELLRWCC
ncbi:hypothetical protein Tco_0634063 [Tanacetum coccineum]